MRRLYWYNLGKNKAQLASATSYYHQIGGMGLNFSPLEVRRGSSELHGELNHSTGYFTPDDAHHEDYVANQVVVVRNMAGNEYRDSENHPFFTSGRRFMEAIEERKLVKMVEDLPIFWQTEEGKPVNAWDMVPLMVVPLYNGMVDQNLSEWEMFEEGGFIYGLDKRTGNIHELQHLTLSYHQSFSNNVVIWEMYVISNQELSGTSPFQYALKQLEGITFTDSDYIGWARDVAENKQKAILSIISSHGKMDDYSEVIRYNNGE